MLQLNLSVQPMYLCVMSYGPNGEVYRDSREAAIARSQGKRVYASERQTNDARVLQLMRQQGNNVHRVNRAAFKSLPR